MLSIDKKIFEEESDVRARMLEYGTLFDELHIVVYIKRQAQNSKLKAQNIGANVFLYPTNTVFKFLYFLNAYKICKKIIKNNSIDIITSQDAFTNLIAVKLKRKFKNIKIQIQLHTDFLSERFKKESLKNFFRYYGYVKGVKNADCVRVVSKRIENSLEKSGVKDQKSKVKVLPIFVDVEGIKNALVSVDLRKKYPQFDFIILMVSRLEKEKDIPLAIEAMREVVKKEPKVGLVIVSDGSQLKALNLQTTSYKLQANIVFDGWQDKETIISYYKTADLFLQTSKYEGYGLALVEALAAGLPSLSTDVGVAKESGAMITERDAVAENVIKYMESERERGVLKNYPYGNKGEYLNKFRESFEQC